MLNELDTADFMSQPAEAYLQKYLSDDTLHWWEPYREVHRLNQTALHALAQKIDSMPR